MPSDNTIDDSAERDRQQKPNIPPPQRSLTWPRNYDVTSHTEVNDSRHSRHSRHNTVAEQSSSNGLSHSRSLSYHLSQSMSRRRDSIRHAVKRLSSMIPGCNQNGVGREIPINPDNKDLLVDPRTKKPFINNSITTSRYKIYDFLPKQIIYQFSKIANVYFLFVAILQSIPEFSPTGRFTTIIPLSVFMAIAIAHEGFDDYRRHKQDQIENNKECSVLNVYKSNDSTTQHLGIWRKTKWRNVKVGDLVSVKAQEWIPADLLLLHSAGEEGTCYIETAALDGETNLKQRQALKETNSTVTTPEALAGFRATVNTENPNQDLYNFDGSITLADGETYSLTNNQILLRGTILRNTPEIYGLVVFTGEETKLRMNASKNIRTKAPSIQKLMNKVVIIIFCFVLFLSAISTISSVLWDSDTGKDSFYLPKSSKHLHVLAGFIILFNTMIPISLYVTMEVVKLAQAYFINNDLEMYHKETDTPAEARTSTINEELGQVSYLFSDKTGTLTDNIMLFRKLSVGGRAFIHDLDLRRIEEEELLKMMKRPRKSSTIQRYLRRFSISARRHNRSQTRDDSNGGDDEIALELSRSDSIRSGRFSMIAPNSTGPSPLYRRDSTSGVSLRSVKSKTGQHMKSTLDLLTILYHQSGTPFYEKARFFLLAIALCHTCVPEIDEETDDIFYQAASPDEFALITAAKELGYVVMDRSMGTVSLRVNNYGPNGFEAPSSDTTTYETYKILNVIEFSSKRKRMSIIYRLPDGRICLLCKGADSIVLERLRDPVRKYRGVFDKKEKYNESENRPFDLRIDTSIVNGSSSNQSESSATLSNPNTPKSPSSVHEIYASPVSIKNPHSHERSFSIRTVDSDRSTMDLFPICDDTWLYSQTMCHIQDFATEGLRTLLYAHRFMDEEEYAAWNNSYQEATTSLVDRQQKLEEIAELVERDLEITGATAIEDKLQNGVPETIDKLRRAGIRIWMLTGDKRETAINIGYSCSLIKDYSTTIIIDSNVEDLKSMMKRALKDVKNGKAQHPVAVIDGTTLMKVENNPDIMEIFVDLGILCEAVICCRVSPSQKALVVRNIRNKLTNHVTLAIGDGANDIAMIQEAHVGIGITGREGLQAARSSDYSIAQFRFLSNLLFVHGRWSYSRVSKFVLGTFYKCMCFYLTQGLFQLFTGFSGTSLYEQWTLSFYNTLFSSLPVIVIGMFEKDLKMKTLIGVPELYNLGQRNGGFNLKLFFSWMGAGVFHAIAITGIPILIHGFWEGYELGIFGSPQLYELGMTIYSCVVIVVTIKIAYLECHNWTLITHATSILTLIGWYLYQTIYSFLYPKSSGEVYDVNGTFQRVGGKWEYWTTVILTVSVALLPNLFVKVVKSIILPTDVDIYQEVEKDKKLLDRLIEEGGKGANDDNIEGGFKNHRRENEKGSEDSKKDNMKKYSFDNNNEVHENSMFDVDGSETTIREVSDNSSITTTLSSRSPIRRLRSTNSLDDFTFPKQNNNDQGPPSYQYNHNRSGSGSGSGSINVNDNYVITPKASIESFGHLNSGNNNMETLIEETEDDLQSKRSSSNII